MRWYHASLTRLRRRWSKIRQRRALAEQFEMVAPLPRKTLTRTALLNTGVVVLIYGPSICVYQFIIWLKAGYWPDLPVSELWFWLSAPYPAFSNTTVQHAAVSLLGAPISVAISLIGVAMILIAYLRR